MANHSEEYRKKRNQISRNRKKKGKKKKHILTLLELEAENKKIETKKTAVIIKSHKKSPRSASKFKNVVNYAEVQKEHLRPNWELRLKKRIDSAETNS